MAQLFELPELLHHFLEVVAELLRFVLAHAMQFSGEVGAVLLNEVHRFFRVNAFVVASVPFPLTGVCPFCAFAHLLVLAHLLRVLGAHLFLAARVHFAFPMLRLFAPAMLALSRFVFFVLFLFALVELAFEVFNLIFPALELVLELLHHAFGSLNVLFVGPLIFEVLKLLFELLELVFEFLNLALALLESLFQSPLSPEGELPPCCNEQQAGDNPLCSSHPVLLSGAWRRCPCCCSLPVGPDSCFGSPAGAAVHAAYGNPSQWSLEPAGQWARVAGAAW